MVRAVCVVNLLWNGAKDSLEDDARPGQAHRVNTPEMIAEWVSNQLTTEQRYTRIALSLSHLQRYHEQEYGFMWQIVIVDKTCCHHFEPESKRQSMQWKRAISSPPKKSKTVHTSSGKVMMSSFFTTRAYLLSSFWNDNHH
ncbi:histone-lysine N-methyltransferase SETMAR [Trichonephila clavipes]|nr:histone-lysine N-methyltransferase SETMAR [Trichonephila clavipes]